MKAPGSSPNGVEWDAELNQMLRDMGTTIAKLGIAFHLVTLFEEYEHTSCLLEIREQDGKWIYDFCAKKCPNKSLLEEIMAYIELTLTKRMLSTNKISIKCIDESISFKCFYADDISYEMFKIVENTVIPILHKLSFRDYEYFVIITWSGDVVVGKGEEERVMLPSIPHVFFGHTHPNETCIPSPADLESILDALSNGAIIEAVVSRLCSFIVRLKRPLNINEYDEFLKLVEWYKHGRIDIEDLLLKLGKIDSIEVQTKIGH